MLVSVDVAIGNSSSTIAGWLRPLRDVFSGVDAPPKPIQYNTTAVRTCVHRSAARRYDLVPSSDVQFGTIF